MSDGVSAVAMTLLVLDLQVEANGGESLAARLGHHWPNFAAYPIATALGLLWPPLTLIAIGVLAIY